MDTDRTEDQAESLLAALEAHEDDAHEGEADERDRPTQDVRGVLDEIGAEEAVAHLDARIAGLEQELERRDVRQRDADRTRRGELELQRARIEDVLELVRSSMDDQREAWSRFESRFVDLVADAEEAGQGHLAELREELTPRLEGALLRLEEAEAQLRGEIRSVAHVNDERAAATEATLGELRQALERVAAAAGQRADREAQERAEATGRLERLLEEHVQRLADSTTTVSEELGGRLAGLQRELDSAVGELRAALHLRASELESQLGDVEHGLRGRVEAEVEGLEERWIAGTRDIARRVEQLQGETQELLAAEREARRSADDETIARLDEVAGVVEELHGAAASSQAGRRSESEQVRRDLDELASRLDVLQSKVAGAVGQIASQLTNRVASLGAEQQALREAGVRREERLAGVDVLEARLSELGRELGRLRDTARDDDGEEERKQLAASLAALRHDLSGLSGTVGSATTQLREVAGSVERLTQEAQERAALRQEVRELTSRNAELAERLDETERLARAAGRAIASAVRRSRSAQQREDREESLFFHHDAGGRGGGDAA